MPDTKSSIEQTAVQKAEWMSLDLASLLKDEIVKKQQALKAPTENNSVVETPQPQNTAHDGNEEEADEEQGQVEEETNVSAQLERLNSRASRVEKLITEDSKIGTKIDPASIGDETHHKTLSLQCNLYIHHLLTQWDENQQEYHPELLIETKKSLFPLLVKLRRGTLPRDLVISLATVLYHLQQPNENTLAIESYMKLSIGNVAWPIGVTSIGIHARSAHSKIQGENGPIANIMLDDITRLWITSIKRLITFQDWIAST